VKYKFAAIRVLACEVMDTQMNYSKLSKHNKNCLAAKFTKPLTVV
jgi:hypothetical protein